MFTVPALSDGYDLECILGSHLNQDLEYDDTAWLRVTLSAGDVFTGFGQLIHRGGPGRSGGDSEKEQQELLAIHAYGDEVGAKREQNSTVVVQPRV